MPFCVHEAIYFPRIVIPYLSKHSKQTLKETKQTEQKTQKQAKKTNVKAI